MYLGTNWKAMANASLLIFSHFPGKAGMRSSQSISIQALSPSWAPPFDHIFCIRLRFPAPGRTLPPRLWSLANAGQREASWSAGHWPEPRAVSACPAQPHDSRTRLSPIHRPTLEITPPVTYARLPCTCFTFQSSLVIGLIFLSLPQGILSFTPGCLRLVLTRHLRRLSYTPTTASRPLG